MPEDMIAKLPPTIVMTSEFDFFCRDATCFANRLESQGRLLDFYSHPGTMHCYEYMCTEESSKIAHIQLQRAWKKYVMDLEKWD